MVGFMVHRSDNWYLHTSDIPELRWLNFDLVSDETLSAVSWVWPDRSSSAPYVEFITSNDDADGFAPERLEGALSGNGS